jgi:hypothetical protein
VAISSIFGHFLAIFWPFFGHFLAILGPFLGHFGAILGPLGTFDVDEMGILRVL